MQFWGSYTLAFAPMGVKFVTEEGTFPSKFLPHWCNVSPLWGEKPQNRPLSKLNTGALRALNAAGNKNSAAAQMGDRCHKRYGPKREGQLCPIRG